MDQILRDSGGEVTLSNYDASGAPSDVNGTEAPTVAVADSGGAAVPGFTPSRTGTGAYKATLPNNLETLDTYDVVWSWTNGQSRRTQFKLVGGFLFSIVEFQAFDSALANKTASDIRSWREVVEERFEKVGKVSFTLRGRRGYLHGRGTCELILPDVEVRSIVTIKVDGTALSSGDLANMKLEPWGQLVWDGGTFASGFRNVEVLYEHGYVTAPEPVRRAGLKLAKSLALVSAMEQSERATAVFTDVGGYRLSIAGRDGPTGLPEVDAVLAEFGRMPAGGLA